jgi:hypothetical protein
MTTCGEGGVPKWFLRGAFLVLFSIACVKEGLGGKPYDVF